MPKEQEVGAVIDLFFKKGKKLVVDAKPVNIFIDPESIDAGMKSVTFSITFQHTSKTLEDKDVTPVIKEIIRSAEKEFLAKLRA
jgi:phenylalanyl-tRNA synthetase beta chain